jgi:hypothetical protein
MKLTIRTGLIPKGVLFGFEILWKVVFTFGFLTIWGRWSKDQQRRFVKTKDEKCR